MVIFSVLCLSIALICLIYLTIIDLRHYLLPDIYTLPFGLSGFLFHAIHNFQFISFENLANGLLLGMGLLGIIRFLANLAYGRDTLGLGDVKLMAMAGLWIGYYAMPLALIIGAIAAIIHGFAMALYQYSRQKSWPQLNQLMIPAGPGLIFGILTAGLGIYFQIPLFL
jgi:leader peptidase (prepilin peptidase)/N-methyltransferase